MKQTLRTELIKNKLEELKQSVLYLEEFLPDNAKELEKRATKNALYKECEVAIELTIDICAMLNKDLHLGVPKTEDDIMNNLKKRNILPGKTVDLIHQMKGFRNLLVHRYGDLDDKQAYINIKEGLTDFSVVIKDIEHALKKHP